MQIIYFLFLFLFQNRTGANFVAEIMQNRNADFIFATSVLVLPDYAWRIEGDDYYYAHKSIQIAY